jgi:hypothetical protein
VASPVVQVRIPETVLAAVDEVRGDESRSAWILGAIGLRLSPLAEAVAAVIDPAADPGTVIPAAVLTGKAARETCPHPKRRVIRGFCGACGTGGLG